MLYENVIFDKRHEEGINIKFPKRLDNKIRVYIVLVDSKKPFISTAIKTATDTPYNHSSISFDDDLQKMYSFNIEKDGPVVENIHDTYKDNAIASVYYMYITNEQYNIMTNLIKNIFKSTEYNFNFKGMLLTKLDAMGEQDNKFFCSQFVAWLFEKANIKLFNKSSDKVIPYDFANTRQLKSCYEGRTSLFNGREMLSHMY